VFRMLRMTKALRKMSRAAAAGSIRAETLGVRECSRMHPARGTIPGGQVITS
jgi:hypothetical protein